MDFQSVSVGQKLEHNAANTGPDGYLDAAATPSPELASALGFVDASLGKMVAALRSQGLLTSTLIIVTAKHGQSPINSKLLVKIDPSAIDAVINRVPGFSAKHPLVAQDTEDDIALVWLTDQSKTGAAVAALSAAQASALQAKPPAFGLGIQQILSGPELTQRFGDPTKNPRAPDLVVVPIQGVIYTGSTKKIAEHGGFNSDDTHVALLVSNPGLQSRSVQQPVLTTQIAPTILQALGLDATLLQGVRLEGTTALPGF
jgi:arylsulfatase A-like enzyme